MKKEYILLISATAGIALATTFSLLTESLWMGFYMSFAVGVIYLFFLYRWADSQLTSPSYKKAIGIFLLLLVVLQSLSLIYANQASVRQSETLNNIGTSIDQTISQATIEQGLIKALLHYHHKADKDDRSIPNSYKTIMGDKLADDGMITLSKNQNERMSYRADFPNSETVIITMASKMSKGEDPEFININDRTGKFQASISLTPEGVDYVREN